MAITLVQTPQTTTTSASTVSLAYATNVTAGSLLVASAYYVGGASTTITGVSDNVNGAWTLDATGPANVDVGYIAKIFSFPNSAPGAITVTLTLSGSDDGALTIYELAGAATSSPKDVSGGDNADGNPSATLITTQANDCIIAALAEYSPTYTVAAGTNFTLVNAAPGGSGQYADERWLDSGASGSKTVGFTLTGGSGGLFTTMAAVAYKAAAGAATPLGMFGGN